MPRGSMLKFLQDRGGPQTEHNGHLHWPGTEDGFPYRGAQAPDLKQAESESIPLALDYKSRLFQLWEPEEKAAFDQIMDRIVNGWYMQHKRENITVDGHTIPAVWLEWVQIYGESPASKSPLGSGSNDNGTTYTARPGDPRAMPPTAAGPHPSTSRFQGGG